ncbi:deoxynucleoside kinase [Mycoplasma putrefaciens]|uniref:deoxynucleoside kinase n=1 Tax=Mycoplasma putrefaciens TaxID=2123 RepID=UPI003DA231A5
MKIAIFGTTGAGKTTLISNLKKLLPENYFFVDENLNSPYFDQAYNDLNPDLESLNYKLDLWMLTDRFKTIKKYAKNKDVIFDRTFLDSMVFVETDYDYKRLNQVDYQVFKDYFTSCVIANLTDQTQDLFKFDAVIYLKVDYQKSLERIKKRNRKEELDTEKKFWYDLWKNYQIWYEKYQSILPFWVVDANSDDSMSYAKKIADRIIKIDKQKSN